jgi:hypothetical protein
MNLSAETDPLSPRGTSGERVGERGDLLSPALSSLLRPEAREMPLGALCDSDRFMVPTHVKILEVYAAQ